MYREVRGRLLKFSGEAFANLPVIFSFTGSFTNEHQYLAHSQTISTDSEGRFNLSLWINEEGLTESKYCCKFLNEAFYFTLESGEETVNLSDLRSQTVETDPIDVIIADYQLLEYSGSNSFQLNKIVSEPQKVLLYVNGYKANFSTDFNINGSILNWLNTFPLESSDIIEAYY